MTKGRAYRPRSYECLTRNDGAGMAGYSCGMEFDPTRRGDIDATTPFECPIPPAVTRRETRTEGAADKGHWA